MSDAQAAPSTLDRLIDFLDDAGFRHTLNAPPGCVTATAIGVRFLCREIDALRAGDAATQELLKETKAALEASRATNAELIRRIDERSSRTMRRAGISSNERSLFCGRGFVRRSIFPSLRDCVHRSQRASRMYSGRRGESRQ